jgi:hypothetical protein
MQYLIVELPGYVALCHCLLCFDQPLKPKHRVDLRDFLISRGDSGFDVSLDFTFQPPEPDVKSILDRADSLLTLIGEVWPEVIPGCETK